MHDLKVNNLIGDRNKARKCCQQFICYFFKNVSCSSLWYLHYCGTCDIKLAHTTTFIMTKYMIYCAKKNKTKTSSIKIKL